MANIEGGKFRGIPVLIQNFDNIAGTGCFQKETNFIGHDIGQALDEIGDAKLCRKKCIKEVGCNAWTYMKSSKKCQLKFTTDEVSTGNSDFISGPKFCKGIFKREHRIAVLKTSRLIFSIFDNLFES